MNTTGQGPLRGEELIAQIYAQVVALRSSRGGVPTATPGRIVMSIDHYRLLQDYRARLGDAPSPGLEYLGRYELFGLPIYINDEAEPRIEA